MCQSFIIRKNFCINLAISILAYFVLLKMEMQTLKNSKVISEVIKYDAVNIYMIEPGIIVSEYTKEFELELDFAMEINAHIGRLTNYTAMPQLFIACPGLTVSKEVRNWGVTETANKYTLVSGIVCNQLAHRILGNFIIKVQKPPRPTQMFASFEDAVRWLTAHLQ